MLPRGAVLDPFDDHIAKQLMPDQLALAGAPTGGFVMRGGAVVAVVSRQALIAEPISFGLAMIVAFERGNTRAISRTGGSASFQRSIWTRSLMLSCA